MSCSFFYFFFLLIIKELFFCRAGGTLKDWIGKYTLISPTVYYSHRFELFAASSFFLLNSLTNST